MAFVSRHWIWECADFLCENSRILIFASFTALVWANTSSKTYHTVVSEQVHFIANEVLMTLFFLLVAKEIRESMLPEGALANPRAAALPLLATLGGMIGPAVLFLLGSNIFAPELQNGWAVPVATDIAFSYMVARFIFGVGHPAIPFLLLLAIADDAGGLLILALFYPTKPINPFMFPIIAAAIGMCMVLYKVLKWHSWWWYILPGVVSWFGFYLAGLHPALSCVPLVWCMQHEKRDAGFFVEKTAGQRSQHDTLNQFKRFFARPVEVILGVFGFVNAGVEFSAIGTGTFLVLVALMLGKPLGITLFTWAGIRFFGLKLSEGMSLLIVVVLGCVAGIGFTVALFVASILPEHIQGELKMGALLSILSTLSALVAARVVGLWKVAS